MSVFISGLENCPNEILEGRQTTEGMVIGSIASDLLLLDECHLETKDFITQDGAYFFALFKHVRKQGISVLDEISLLANITENMLEGLQNRGGWKTLQHMKDVCKKENFPSYLDRLSRENTILSLYRSGFNLLEPIVEKDKTIIPLKLFRKMDAESVIEWYEARLSTFGTGYSTKVLEEEVIDFDDQFIEDCVAGLENGVPFDCFDMDIDGNEISCMPFLSQQMNGYMDGTFNILGGFSSTGKTSLWITILLGLIHRGRKVLIVSNEQKCKVFKINLIIWLLFKRYKYMNLTKSKMQNGSITAEDRAMIKKVQEYWKDNYYGKIKFIAIPDADTSLLKKKVRENVLRHGYDTVLYDTLKCDFSDTSSDSKEYISLIKDSRLLDQIAKKYNIIVLASMQLALSNLGRLWLDASTLSMSKAVKEVCETLLLMRSVYTEELDSDNKKYYIRPFRRVKRDGRWVEEPFNCDKTATWRVLFVDKNRNGQDSAGDGVAYLLKFRGQYCVFSESCLCRPKHGNISSGV